MLNFLGLLILGLLIKFNSFAQERPRINLKIFLMHTTHNGVKVVSPQTPYNIDTLQIRTASDWFENSQNLNDKDFKRYLESYVHRKTDQNLDDNWTKESIENLVIKRRISRAHHLSEDEIVKFSADQIKHKSFEQKVNFFRSLMEDISYLWDYKRTKGVGDIEIGLGKLFKGLNNFYESDKVKVGVCRDMHQGVLRIMRKFDIEAFGSSYVTPASSHINIIFTDPNDENTLIGLNYEHLDYRSGKPGQSLLTMNHGNPSIGFGFYIWNEKDRVELFVPSDKSILLYRATNGDLEEFNPFLQEENKVIQGELSTRLGQLGLFYAIADSGDGTKVTGVSLDDQFNFSSEFLNGNHGQALFLSNRSLGIEDEYVNTYGYYGRAFIELFKKINVGSNHKIKFNLTSLTQFAVFYADVKSETYQIDVEKMKLDGSLALGAGVHLEQSYLSFDSNLYLKIEGLPQTKDITMFSLYHPFSAGLDLGFSRLLTGQDLYLKRMKYFKTKIYWKLMYHHVRQRNMFLGQIGADFQLNGLNTQLGVRAQDCISDNCHIWMIGSRKSVQFNFSNNYFKRVSFGANAMINEYDTTQYYLGLMLRGTI